MAGFTAFQPLAFCFIAATLVFSVTSADGAARSSAVVCQDGVSNGRNWYRPG